MDLHAVADLADELARFASRSMFAEAQAVNGSLNTHAPFGVASASGEVVAARSRYSLNMVRLVQSVHEYAREAAQLSVALHQAVTDYAGGDAQAEASVASAGEQVVPVGFIGPVAPHVPDAQEVVASPPPAHVAEGEALTEAGWCTNWSAYGVPAMWRMVKSDNVCAGEAQELSWHSVTKSLADQIGVLEKKQAALAGVWSSPHASQGPLQRIDDLLKSMRQAVHAATETRRALGEINKAVASAQQDLGNLADTYHEKSNDWKLRAFDGAEDELNEKARVRMAQLDQEVRKAISPVPEVPGYVATQSDRDGLIGDPPRPSDSSDGLLARRDPPAPSPGVDPVMRSGGEWTSSSHHRHGTVLSSTPSSPSVPPVVQPPVVCGGPVVSVPVVPTGPVVGGPMVPRTFGVPARPTVPGLIGGPGRGPSAGMLGEPGGMAGRSASRAVPGLIGGPAGGVRSGGSGGAGAGPMVSGAPGGRGRRSGEGDGAVGRADVVWETRTGVPPVIEPSKAPVDHDPGPGVIGIDW